MTDLAEVVGDLLPNATWAGDPTGAAAGRGRVTGAGAPASLRPIAWVRVMRPRVPAFDGLEAGDLVIAPASALAVIATGAAELDGLVAALAAVPVSGVLLVAGESGADGLEAAAAALTRAGVPAVRVPRTDPPALERSVVGYIVARGAELERQAALLEAELRRRALEGGGISALVATVSEFLGRALALESGRGEPIVVHAPVDVPSAAADAARYQAARGKRRVALRVELPSASGATGAMVALGGEPASELARITLPRVAGLLALELAREDAVRGAADQARRAEPMPGAGPPWIVALARQREPGAEDDAPAARAAREAKRRELRLLAPAKRLSLRGDADSLEIRIVAAGSGDEIDRLVDRLAEILGRPLAISSRFHAPADRPAAEAEARATLEAALALEQPPPIARADRLAMYRMLGALHKLPDGSRLALAVLAPLLDARPDVRRERLQTLRALLAHGGVGEAAAALGVHRNTIAYRVRSIEAATGWRLADPELRLPLSVAVGLVQEDQL
ncbi:MAG TPA: helix-turn-helix domain-containing protein [Candidatus Limnocylindria bacterium]|nr:helix-turn-helix domain-containing protein [Candidatus Limnocylindria bacterium]